MRLCVDSRKLVVTTSSPRTQQLGLQTLGGGDIHHSQEAWEKDNVWGGGREREQSSRPAFPQVTLSPYPSCARAGCHFPRTENRADSQWGAGGGEHRHLGEAATHPQTLAAHSFMDKLRLTRP